MPCCLIFDSGFSFCSCLFDAPYVCEGVAGTNIWPNSPDPIAESVYYDTAEACLAGCPNVAANALCPRLVNQGGASPTCADNILRENCAGTFYPNANCNTVSCSEPPNPGFTSELKNVKFYINNTWICIPMYATDFSGYELCEVS